MSPLPNPTGIRILICGSRDWDDGGAVNTILNAYLLMMGDITVIEGGARGADALAAQWAEEFACLCVRHEQYRAAWDTHGKAAGPRRNQRMLDEGKPRVVWAFHDDLARSKGTADMVRRAQAAGVSVYVVSHPPELPGRAGAGHEATTVALPQRGHKGPSVPPPSPSVRPAGLSHPPHQHLPSATKEPSP